MTVLARGEIQVPHEDIAVPANTHLRARHDTTRAIINQRRRTLGGAKTLNNTSSVVLRVCVPTVVMKNGRLAPPDLNQNGTTTN